MFTHPNIAGIVKLSLQARLINDILADPSTLITFSCYVIDKRNVTHVRNSTKKITKASNTAKTLRIRDLFEDILWK